MLGSTTTFLSVLAEEEWQTARRRHEERLRPFLETHLIRQSRKIKHPVYDFLFEYYSFRPGPLRQWTPGIGIVLQGGTATDFPAIPEFSRRENGVWLDPAGFPAHRQSSLEWIIRLLETTRERPPRFGCFGLHEWAMVYQANQVRHDQIKLRLEPEPLAEFVRSQPITCSHYDAFRFFTDAARPLNRLQPLRQTRLDLDQSGCLHVNMDIYKWAHKFYPWTPSDLIADAFELAVAAREIDMRASPYDLTGYGFPPIRIETPEGRSEYAQCQQQIFRRSQPVRAELLKTYHRMRDEVAAQWLSQPFKRRTGNRRSA